MHIENTVPKYYQENIASTQIIKEHVKIQHQCVISQHVIPLCCRYCYNHFPNIKRHHHPYGAECYRGLHHESYLYIGVCCGRRPWWLPGVLWMTRRLLENATFIDKWFSPTKKNIVIRRRDTRGQQLRIMRRVVIMIVYGWWIQCCHRTFCIVCWEQGGGTYKLWGV